MKNLIHYLIPVVASLIPLLSSPEAEAAPPNRQIPLLLPLVGGLDLTPTDDGRIRITAKMSGIARFLGVTKAEAVWSAPQSAISDLESGLIHEVNIGNGTLVASTANGSTVTGSFSGRLVRLPSGMIGHESNFIIHGGEGRLKNVTGSGTMTGSASPQTLEFKLSVTGSMVVPRN